MPGTGPASSTQAIETLRLLIERRNRVVDTDELMGLLWPDQLEVGENNLAFHISKLRRALGENPSDRRYILTVPRHGYQFVAEVKEQVSNCVDKPHSLVQMFAPISQSACFTIASVRFNQASGNETSMENFTVSSDSLKFNLPTAICNAPSVSRSDSPETPHFTFAFWVRNLKQSASFYQKLGFALTHLESSIAELCWGELTLLLEESVQLPTLLKKPLGTLCLPISNVDTAWSQAKQNELPTLRNITDRENGLRDFEVKGPDWFTIRFVSRPTTAKRISPPRFDSRQLLK